ncbi:MAG: hypothetical protein V8R01_08175 [Bacilli bacterium]
MVRKNLELSKQLPKAFTTLYGVPGNQVSFLFVADQHIGSKKENLDYAKILYQFAVDNGYSIIIKFRGHSRRHAKPSHAQNPFRTTILFFRKLSKR